MATILSEIAINGIANGCIYALIALGFNLVYRTTGALNFALGHLVMFGAFVATTAVALTLGNALAGTIVTVLLMGAVGLLIGRLVYIPLGRRHGLWFIVATLALSLLLENLVILAWGPTPRTLESVIPLEAIRLGDIFLSGPHLGVIGVVILVLGGLSWFFFKTVMGARFRATAQDEEVARLVGIETSRVALWSFGVGTALAGLAGVLLGPITLVTNDLGRGLILKGFIAVVIGGFGSLGGGLIGGVALGIAEVILAQSLSSSVKEILLFAGLVVLLVLRPQGFLGEEVGERA